MLVTNIGRLSINSFLLRRQQTGTDKDRGEQEQAKTQENRNRLRTVQDPEESVVCFDLKTHVFCLVFNLGSKSSLGFILFFLLKTVFMLRFEGLVVYF
jgi:hypothetical protein